MRVTFMGTGTSHGIPVVNCDCPCCTSKDPKDTRFRCSIKVESKNGTIVVVDTGPEFRLQTLKYGLPNLDSVFLRIVMLITSTAWTIYGFLHMFMLIHLKTQRLLIYTLRNTRMMISEIVLTMFLSRLNLVAENLLLI